ncbi:hypothetical protein FND48_08665 [Bacillus sp. PW192]|nr:hypothetical protein FND48_08665 [Bacillus sp. PW192]
MEIFIKSSCAACQKRFLVLMCSTVGVDEEFKIPGSSETCMYPRDTAEEKEKIRREALANME